MGEEGVISNTCVFRGAEFEVTLLPQGDSAVTVEVEDRLSNDQWRAVFDADYIEDLTHKTGNYKQFPIFVSMLESAVVKSSDSVSLDLLTYADLESLRSRSSVSGVPRAKPAGLPSKRYLILTYTVEFDRIHYPLPLPYVGKPDPRALQDLVHQLRQELKTLKQQRAGDFRSKEHEKLKKDYARLLREKEELQAEYDQFKTEIKYTSKGAAAKEIRILKSAIKNLEEDLLQEKTKYQRSSSKRNHEYRKLQDEVEELRASERNLRVRVKSLTNELAIYKRRSANISVSSGKRDTSRRDMSTRSSFLRDRSSSRESVSRSHDLSRASRLSKNSSYSRERSRPRDRSLSIERSRTLDRSWSLERSQDRSRGSYRSRASSPSSSGYRFDPTAYVKEKKRKNNEAKQKQKRNVRSGISGVGGRKSQPRSRPPVAYPDRMNGVVRPRSRASSAGSIRSRTSSMESMSDVGFQSDASVGRTKGSISKKTARPARPSIRTSAWSSPDVSYEKPAPAKILSSTPEGNRKKKGILTSRENMNSDAGESEFDRSAEMSEIDQRLKRLQQYMNENMP